MGIVFLFQESIHEDNKQYKKVMHKGCKKMEILPVVCFTKELEVVQIKPAVATA